MYMINARNLLVRYMPGHGCILKLTLTCGVDSV